VNTPIDAPAAGPGNTTAAGPFGTTMPADLGQRSVRGGGAALLAQGLAFALQMGSMIVLARLLSPEDFGLQGMVVVMTGFLSLFRDAGLSVASVQQEVLTHDQTSTLFWINVAVGTMLTMTAVALAPFLAAFYKEPRLFSVTIASAASFLFNSLGVQHRALLNRALRFVTIAKIDVLALSLSTIIGVSMATLGFGYWALVGMAISNPMITAAAAWMAIPWLPGRPARRSGVGSMLRIGGTVTLNGLVVYIAFNTEKLLLGRFWGAEALGLYGRAYQLATQPVQQLNSSVSAVAFPALSRLQSDAERLRRSFLKGYSVIVSMTIPVTIISALFAEEIVRILLGPKWNGAAVVLRLLAPRALVSALVNPLGWFLMATGQVGRSLNIALLIAPVVIIGIVAGLPHGPAGVALGYSTAMVVLVMPIIAWAKHGTGMATRDFWNSIKRPLAAGAMAGAAGWLFKVVCTSALTPIPLLILGLTLSLGVYVCILLAGMGQRRLYVDLVNQMSQRRRPRPT
jgi:O-antigen/teichoic acid export membrane protein